jgi:hypothetical protein
MIAAFEQDMRASTARARGDGNGRGQDAQGLRVHVDRGLGDEPRDCGWDSLRGRSGDRSVREVVFVNPLHHYYRPEHLAHVIAEMNHRGPPVLRAHFDGEMWHASEGTHRLRAAKILGLAPVLVPVPWRRTQAALQRARAGASRAAHVFDRVEIRA